MKSTIRMVAVGFLLGLALAARAGADEIEWTAVPSTPTRISGVTQETQPNLPVAPGTVAPVAFRPGLGLPMPLFRARPEEEILAAQGGGIPKPLPVTPPVVESLKPSKAPTLTPPPAVVPDSAGAEIIPTKPRLLFRHPWYDEGGCCQDTVAASPVLAGDCCGLVCGDCCPCDCCPYRGNWWLSAEYLLWGFKDPSIPPLVTRSPVGTPINNAGVLNQPTTTVLLDSSTIENSIRSGFRLSGGFWIPRCCDLGLDASFFILAERNENFIARSNGDPILARPLIDATNGREIAELVAFPNVVSGAVRVDYFTRLWGLDVNFRKKWCCGPRFYWDCLLGYRHIELDEGINITEDLQAGTTGIIVMDRFGAQNSFNGVQIGFEAGCQFFRRWYATTFVKVALGNMHEKVSISGNTIFNPAPPAAQSIQNGGILALPTNIGNYQRDRFAVVPEVGVKVGFEVNDHWRFFVGYNFLYMSNVVRAGDQIDRTVNVSQVPTITGPGTLVGPARPAVLFRTTDFWAQGVNFGLECRY